VPGAEEVGRGTRPVLMFWEKPPAAQTPELWRKGALWNSFVCIAQSSTLWQMTQQLVPNLYEDFSVIRQAIGTPAVARLIEKIYVHLPAVNFSAGICEPLAAALRVLPVSATGWSDWGSAERIWATIEQLGRQEEYYARVNRSQRQQTPALPHAPEKVRNSKHALKACG
jgi:mannose-1-phosphate guanylyltransferase